MTKAPWSKCSECGEMFEDSAPNAPLVLCPRCELEATEREKSVYHLTSDGGFGPRPVGGRKVGGPRVEDDIDANGLKDPD